MSGYRIELLGRHDRSAFESGSGALDRYLREQAGQDMRRRIASCFVSIDSEERVAGFYTLAATSLLLDRLPPDRSKRLPRYPSVPAVLLGRLAIDRAHQGRKLGGALVADAIMRATRSDLMALAMLVQAKDEQAARFYEHLGFQRLPEDSTQLIRAL